jgi:pyruvate carboxylase subunit B
VNDTRNMVTAIEAVKQAGGHAQGTVCYTISPVFTVDTAVQMAKELEAMGCHSLCLKDMAGLLSPYVAAEIIRGIKAATSLPLSLHSHATSGQADMVAVKAVESGVDMIDTAISSFCHGTSHPPTESLVAALRGTEWETGLDLELTADIADYFANVRKKYWMFESNIYGVDAAVLLHQMPGGMISNMVNQLREQKAEHRLPEVLAEMPRVREDMGFPPLVTPTSQIVGAQAVLNVLMGERYKIVSNEVRQYMAGFYGRPPAPINTTVQKQILGDREPITDRPADHIASELEKGQEEAAKLGGKDIHDTLSYVLFPQPAKDFFEWREAGDGPEPEVAAAIAAAIVANEPPAPVAVPVAAGNGAARSNFSEAAWRYASRLRTMRG